MDIFTQEQLLYIEKLIKEAIKHKNEFPDASIKECCQVSFDLLK
tara:strand:+ start:315 stop:446 length:132 start_codon:yes stop_codon:yes gene_type:complete